MKTIKVNVMTANVIYDLFKGDVPTSSYVIPVDHTAGVDVAIATANATDGGRSDADRA